ncbi:site-specific DNA-methyltransferase [Leisingera caerulea]|uniref:site-specific DNA-methyltransferase (adenine-specific) n=1 Tax=Leisingera caerulea TaxID=506591 RepID=A0A9Q9HH54_LEICA|nr:site-specific DNA-methyltransferase [Leisingera caerulea]UWQ55003.1 site-specific DNA-methyltransferase [Leisingera caerulea]
MTELYFKGKEFVYNHHLTVPHRPLEMHAEKGVGETRLDGNLILQGDNLHALKALLPIYAGKVDCIFIDPPYNTGNEGWCYNDNVNSPMIKEWLESNPIGIDDGLRHDKWCAMMWPRLRLLHELLAEDGSFWVTLDNNEVAKATALLDEIFGEENRIEMCIWQKNYSPKPSAKFFSSDHDYVLVYAKNKDLWGINLLGRTDEMNARYSNPDNDPRGPWKPGDCSARNFYSEGTYAIKCPGGRVLNGPPSGRYWTVSETNFWKADKDKRVYWGEDGNNIPAFKQFLSEVKDGRVPQTLWFYNEVGHTQDAKKEINNIMSFEETADVFVTPKPVELLIRVLALATKPDSIILDSFAGSGTTAHAVLEANKRDGGSRRFIIVEMEDYAERLTAERVRRVISGYGFKGTQKTELLREKLTWKKLQNFTKIEEQVEKIENLHGHEYDVVRKAVKDGELIVTGEKKVDERAEGLGGEFTYCTLGAPIEMDKILTGETLPPFVDLATVLFHTATSVPGNPAQVDADEFFMGEANGQMLWLVYKPELDWLKTPGSALSLSFARKIAKEHPKARHLVFAPANHTNPKMLAKEGLKVEFAPLPYALYRVEKA